MNHTRLGILVLAFLSFGAISAHAAGKKGSKRPAAADAKPKKAVTAPAVERDAEPLPAREPEASKVGATTVTSAPAPSPAARDARAEGDDEHAAPRPVSVAPLLGYASASLKLGVGIRAGYTLENRVYLGGTLVYHLGTSDEADGPGGTIGSSAHFLYTGAEVGYELPVGPVVVRPYGGVGVILSMVSLTQGGQSQSDSSTSLAFWPGCTVTYAIPRSSFYVGGDTKLIVATKGGDPSFGLFATGGMRF
jgi:Outer membrane protein beta-barrel domain